MNKKVVIITGPSRAGKDHAGLLLGLPIVKFSAPAKQAFEKMLNVTPGFLESPMRERYVPHPVTGEETDITYLDILKRAYHAWESIFPYGISLPAVEASWQPYNAFVVNDLRKQLEIDLILARFAQEDILHLRIEGRGTVLSTDDNLHLSLAAFKQLYYIANRGTIEEYNTELKRIQKVVNRFIKGEPLCIYKSN